MRRIFFAMAAMGMLYGGMATGAHAASHRDPACSVNPTYVAVGQTYVLSAIGLPTGKDINLVIQDNLGSRTVDLGTTSTGTFALSESSRVDSATWFEFYNSNLNSMYFDCVVQAY